VENLLTSKVKYSIIKEVKEEEVKHGK